MGIGCAVPGSSCQWPCSGDHTLPGGAGPSGGGVSVPGGAGCMGSGMLPSGLGVIGVICGCPPAGATSCQWPCSGDHSFPGGGGPGAVEPGGSCSVGVVGWLADESGAAAGAGAETRGSSSGETQLP